MDVETGGYKLLTLIVIGVAIVIALGVSYTNLAQNQKSVNQTAVNCVGTGPGTPANGFCSTNPGNVFYGNALGVGILKNFSTNSGNVANTGGTNGNYVYYILFMALVLAVVIGVLIQKRKTD